MKSLSNFALLFITLILVSCAHTANGGSSSNKSFVPSLPDVPLPKDFEVDPTTGSFFDSAEGRIAEMYAAGFKKPDEVVSYYNKTLPQFGWENIDNSSFSKDGEVLTITPEKGQYLTTVKYQLRPSI